MKYNIEERRKGENGTGKIASKGVNSNGVKFFKQEFNNEQFYENRIEEETLLTTKQLANALGCSVSYVKKLKKTQRIYPEVNFPKFIRYKYSSVVASLKKSGGTT